MPFARKLLHLRVRVSIQLVLSCIDQDNILEKMLFLNVVIQFGILFRWHYENTVKDKSQNIAILHHTHTDYSMMQSRLST